MTHVTLCQEQVAPSRLDVDGAVPVEDEADVDVAGEAEEE
jgi:hypothetical protein